MKCSQCHQPIEGYETFCSHCGAMIQHEDSIPAVVTSSVHAEYTSSQHYTPESYVAPDYTVVPDSIKKWNWGAFMFNIIWGIGNHSYLPLLCLIPFFNIVWGFVCGFKGNEWAWKSGKFKNEAVFLATQDTWNRAGLVAFVLSLIILGIYLLLFISMFSMMFASM